MKRFNIKGVLLLILFLMIVDMNPNAQCNGIKKMVDKCFEQLGDYKFQKQYEFYVSGAKDDQDVSYTLNVTKGVTYKFQMIGSKRYDLDPVINITHKTKRFLVATSYDKLGDKYYNSVEFKCMATATVVVSFSFPKYQEGCGACVMGIKTE